MNLKTLKLAIHKDNIEYWQQLRQWSYFEFIDVCLVTDEIYDVTIQYDESRLNMLFLEIFHLGAKKGIDLMSKQNQTTDYAAI